MKEHSVSLLLVLFIISPVATADDSKEDLAKRHLTVMENFVSIVSNITGVPSAKQAHRDLADLAAQNKVIFHKAETLGFSHDAVVKHIQERHKERGAAVFQGIFAAMGEMSKLDDFMEIGNYIGKEVNDLSNRTWASLSF